MRNCFKLVETVQKLSYTETQHKWTMKVNMGVLFAKKQIIRNLAIIKLPTDQQNRVIDYFLQYLIYRMVDQIKVEKDGHPNDLVFNTIDEYLNLYLRLFGRETFDKQYITWTKEFTSKSNQNGI